MSFENANNFVVNGLHQLDVHLDNRSIDKIKGFKALRRWVSEGAFHNSGERYDPPKCHPDTRKAVLNKITSWINDPMFRSKVLWLYGPAGAGKSAIAQTTSEKLHNAEKLAASFFFSRSASGRNTVQNLLPTIAYQLALHIPGLKPFIEKAIDKDPSLCSRSLEVQMQDLIVIPLNSLDTPNEDDPDLIVIDGLDECENSNIQRTILRIISEALVTHRPRLRFLITSRPEQEIRDYFLTDGAKLVTTRLALDNSFSPEKDIKVFLRSQFHNVKRTHPLSQFIPTAWPSNEDVQTLVTRSSGQFIYAATVMKYIAFSRERPTKRLDVVLGIIPPDQHNPYAQLDALYDHIMSAIYSFEHTSLILGALLFLRREDSGSMSTSRTPQFMDKFLLFEEGDTFMYLSDLHSVLDIRTEVIKFPIRIFHASLGDFLQDASRSGNYFIDAGHIHARLTGFCLAAFTSMQPIKFPDEDHFSTAYASSDTYIRLQIHIYAYNNIIFHCTQSTVTKELIQILSNCDFERKMIHQETIQNKRMHIPTLISWLQLQSLQYKEIDPLFHKFRDSFDEHHHNLIARYPQDHNLLPFLALTTSSDTDRLEAIVQKVLELHNNDRYTNIVKDLYDGAHKQYRPWLSEFLQSPSRAGKYYLNGDIYARTALLVLKYIIKISDNGSAISQLFPGMLGKLLKHASPSPELRTYICNMDPPVEKYHMPEVKKAVDLYLSRRDDPSGCSGQQGRARQDAEGRGLPQGVSAETNASWVGQVLKKLCLPCM